MTKNEGYKYAMSIRRRHFTHIELEKKMIFEGFGDTEIQLVKAWLSRDFNFINKYKEKK